MSKGLYDILVAPRYSEKATLLNGSNQYVFNVRKNADKNLIKQAIETVFSVKVVAVNTIVMKGKSRRFKGVKGQRPDFKKAVVTLEEGQSIELIAGA